MKIIELEKQFIGKGEVKDFQFTQTHKSETAYIYEVKDGNRVYYEIFKRKHNPVCIDFEKRIYSALKKLRKEIDGI